MPVGEICNREVVIAERSMSVTEAARLMRSHHVGDLVVVEKTGARNRPVGIVTDRDIVVEVVAAGEEPASLTVSDIMGAELATVQESEGIFETMQYMRTESVRRMPVVNHDGDLIGIVTVDDLVTLLAEEMTELAKTVSRQQEREIAARA